MEWNRFDIVEAYYWWLVHHHDDQWSESYRRLCAIEDYFKPSLLSNGPSTDNAQAIYENLCEKEKCTHG